MNRSENEDPLVHLLEPLNSIKSTSFFFQNESPFFLKNVHLSELNRLGGAPFHFNNYVQRL
jgi:hypothetical protein